VIGGHNNTVRALQQKLGAAVELMHYPSDSWYRKHWLELPAGGRPSTMYIGELLEFVFSFLRACMAACQQEAFDLKQLT